MAILDSKGRLFGKLNILDFCASLVILLVIVGVFFFPGTSGSVAQVGTKIARIEVDLIVRGLNVRNPQRLVDQGLTKGGKTNVIIRNHPYGQVAIKSIEVFPRYIIATLPDGKVLEVPDPRKTSFSKDMLLTVTGKAQITDNGPVLGNSKIKIGMPFELEGFNYNFKASVIDIRIED
ncbi:MAG: DUF4330 domain-containing protein [Richelia sp.]|nr:DUF4330 domain-containing protein [Richelia sp.]CDN10366.1 Pyruvate/2-oxoglutarate dehydrogenase complex, dihydrolipoamide dehydrogenase (E3) component, and related enzymes [Richelia intracellularis]